LAVGSRLLDLGEVVPPAQLLQQYMVELGVAAGQLRALRMRAVFCEQTDSVTFHAEVRAEVSTSVHHMLAGVVQVRRARMLELRRAVARPRQAVIVSVQAIAGFLVDAT